MPARGEQDLKHLLRPGAPQVTRTQHAGAVFDRERPEQADHKAPPIHFFCTHALRHPQAIGLPYFRGTAVPADRVQSLRGHDLLHPICVRADAPLTSHPRSGAGDCRAMRSPNSPAEPHRRRPATTSMPPRSPATRPPSTMTPPRPPPPPPHPPTPPSPPPSHPHP